MPTAAVATADRRQRHANAPAGRPRPPADEARRPENRSNHLILYQRVAGR